MEEQVLGEQIQHPLLSAHIAAIYNNLDKEREPRTILQTTHVVSTIISYSLQVSRILDKSIFVNKILSSMQMHC